MWQSGPTSFFLVRFDGWKKKEGSFKEKQSKIMNQSDHKSDVKVA